MPWLLFAAAALALALASGKSAPAWGPNHLATSSDVEPGCPPEILAGINVALQHETSAANLRAFAATIATYYPRAAAILQARATQLGG